MTNVHTSLIVRRSSVVCSAGILTLLITAPALAGPTGGEVVQGSATIQNISDTLTNIVQGSDRAVINWQDFSVAAVETVNFQQPNSDAAILNRVVGSNMSEIAGEIFANGHVYLINPNGMVFSGTSYVDVNGFVATTANVADNVFMSGGQMTFGTPGQSGATITIEEGAQILAGGTTGEDGLVAMIAPGIEHSGIIQASFGQVFIGGAETFTMDLNGDGLYSFALGDAVSGMPANGSVIDKTSTGSIVAQGGTVLIAAEVASDIVGNAINLSGQIFARSAGMDGQGNVVLEARGGDVVLADGSLIDVTGDSAGDVTISGRRVTVASAAVVNARGTQGGGSILIESNGSGAADALTMSGNLFADGGMGNAGSVTLTALNGSDLNATHANDFGFISATGADGTGSITFAGGNDDGMGGADGDYSVSTIVATSGSVDYYYNGGSQLTIGTAGGGALPYIDVASLNSALRGGTAARVDVGGKLTINSLIDGRDSKTPTRASGDLTLIADKDVSVSGTCVGGPCGVFLFDANLDIRSKSGSIFMSAAADAQNQASLLATGQGNITLRADGGGDVDTQDIVSKGDLTIDATSDVTLANPIGGAEDDMGNSVNPAIGSVAISVGGTVTINAIRTGTGGVVVSQSDVLNVNGQIDSAGAVDLNATDTIYLRRSIFTDNSDIDLTAAQILLDPTGDVTYTEIAVFDEGILIHFDTRGDGRAPYEALNVYSLPNREITLSTGGTGAGKITIDGPLDLNGADGLRDFDAQVTSSPDAQKIGDDDFFTGTLDPVPEFLDDADGPDWFYVTLNVDAGTGDINFQQGIAADRADEGVLFDPNNPLSDRFSTNTLSLVVQSGNLTIDPGTRLVVNDFVIEDGATVEGDVIATTREDASGNIEANANPLATVFIIEHRHINVLEAGNLDQPETRAGPGNINNPVDSGVGSNIPVPDTTMNSPPINPPEGDPGMVNRRDQPEIPTGGDAPNAIDDPSRAGDGTDEDSGDTGVVVGGAGVGSDADLGNNSQNSGAAADVFANDHHVAAGDDCVQTDDEGNCIETSESNDYLSQGVFEGVRSGVL